MNYLYARRRTIAKIGGFIGATYIVGKYVKARLEEVRDSVVQDRAARENLRRRFKQNQQDCSFTILALLPTMGNQILEDLDVEAVIRELQAHSRITPATRDRQRQNSTLSSQASSSETESSTSDAQAATSSQMGESTQSWVDASSSVASSSLGPPMTESSISVGSYLIPPYPPVNDPEPVLPVPTRSKAELWKIVKSMTFTRTLTIIYTTTLLSLLTVIQLNVLGRSKYVQSVVQLEREEQRREWLEFQTSVSSLFWGGIPEEPKDILPHAEEDFVDLRIERQYLTLAWWLTHVGWRSLLERVQVAVDNVLSAVSLKEKLGLSDVERLLNAIRDQVENELTPLGQKRPYDFLSTLVPPTPEDMIHTLSAGGVPAPNPQAEPFLSLVSETCLLLNSADSAIVLRASLDRAVKTLCSNLARTIFAPATDTTLPPVEEKKTRLAALLPDLARWSHVALHGLPNELVDSLTESRELSAFSAIIFSSYEERF